MLVDTLAAVVGAVLSGALAYAGISLVQARAAEAKVAAKRRASQRRR